jgi:hypothetical protein
MRLHSAPGEGTLIEATLPALPAGEAGVPPLAEEAVREEAA